MKTNDQRNLKNIGLSQMLEKQFGIKVPAARLESARTIGQLQDLVLPLLRTLGQPIDERAARARVCKVAMVNYRMTFRRAAYDFVCLKCHQRLGVEGVRLGNQRWKGFLDNFHRQKNPGRLVSFMRDLDTVCPHCGCEYTYGRQDSSLHLRRSTGCAGVDTPANTNQAALPSSSAERDLPPSASAARSRRLLLTLS